MGGEFEGAGEGFRWLTVSPPDQPDVEIILADPRMGHDDATAEQIEIGPDAVALLARHATGSFRDALGTLARGGWIRWKDEVPTLPKDVLLERIGDDSELVERRVRPLLPKIGKRLGAAVRIREGVGVGERRGHRLVDQRHLDAHQLH